MSLPVEESRTAGGSRRVQRGAALVLFLGVAAALMALSLALVTLTNNTQSNTSKERMRVKAFDVAEAALDVAMLELTRNWPTDPPGMPLFGYGAFEANFSPDEFPRPSVPGASFVSVKYVDDLDPTKSYDSPANGVMYVDAQAVVGGRASRIHATVQAVYYNVGLMHGLAVWTGGHLLSSGGGGDPDIVVEVFPPGSTAVAVASKLGAVDDEIRALFMPLLTGADAPPREAVLSNAKIEGLVGLAKEMGRYFGKDNGANQDTAEEAWAAAGSSAGGYRGLCVIDAPAVSGQPLRLPQSVQGYNSEASPGLLMVMDLPLDPDPDASPTATRPDLRIQGNTDYWGVIYCQGTVSTASGTPIIHGMVISERDFDLTGTADIRYNDRCVSRLNTRWLTNTRLAPNGWRELQPDITRAP